MKKITDIKGKIPLEQFLERSIIVTPKTSITQARKKWFERDIVLNVGYGNSMKRCLISLFAPMPLLINHTLLIMAVPVMFYYFVTGLVHFCPAKYAWQHWVKHIPDPVICDFAIDLNIPVKTI